MDKQIFYDIMDGLPCVVIPTIPPSTQHVYGNRKGGGKYLKKDGVAYKHEVFYEAKRQYKGEPIEGGVFVGISYFFGDNRVRDLDNYKKVLLDALSGVLWVDDRQIEVDVSIKSHKEDNPRVELYFDKLL